MSSKATCIFTTSTNSDITTLKSNISSSKSKSQLILKPSTRKGAPATKSITPDTVAVVQLFSPGSDGSKSVSKAEGQVSTAWTLQGGFWSRSTSGSSASSAAGKDEVLMTATFVCKSSDAVGKVAARLSKYASWVEANEEGVLTYAVLVAEKDHQVMMFERYANLAVIKQHGGTKEFKGMFRDIKGDISPKETTMQEWVEVKKEGGERGKAKL